MKNKNSLHGQPSTRKYQKISESTAAETTVGYLPIIAAPAHEYDTLWPVIQHCKKIANKLEQQSTVITLDEGLYCKARELAWLRSDDCKHLGGFHISLNYMKAIGQHFADDGLTSDVLIESGVYNEVTVNNIMSGKCWNRAMRCHKLTMEALWQLFWSMFVLWMDENDIQVSLQEASEEVVNNFGTSGQEAKAA